MAYSYTVKPQLNGRVLIVDDDAAFREVLGLALEETGLIVDQATEGDEASRMISESNYSLVITDLQLPKVDGLTLAKQMHASDSPTPPVILITGNSHWLPDEDPPGVHAVFAKPFNASKFLTSVREAISKSRD